MAARTVSNTGGNWNATTTWVGGVVPIAGDTVDFTPTSGNLTVNVSTASLAGINFTNYVGTITFNNNINVNTSVNLGTGGYTQAGASGLVINGTTTITSNGVTWSRTLSFSTGTQTLSDNLSVTGTVTFNGAVTVNSNTFNIGGNLTINGTTSGTSTIIFNGTGAQTWTHGSAIYLSNNLTINKASGTLTIGSLALPNVYYQTGTLTYNNIGGTVDTTTNSSTLNIGASTTLNTNGITWNNFTVLGTNPTITLLSNVNITGTLTFALTSGTLNFTTGGNLFNATGNLSVVSGAINLPNDLYVVNATLGVTTANPTINLNTIYISGNLTTTSSGDCLGTTNVVLNGTGTWSNSSSGIITNNLTIDTLGTITISGIVRYGARTLTHLSGNVITDDSTLFLGFNNSAGTQINTPYITWFNLTITGSTTTTTLLNNVYVSNVLSFNISGANSVNGYSIYTSSFNYINFGTLGGTTFIIFNGNGTWRNNTLRNISLRTIIDCISLELIGDPYFNGSSITYLKGKIKSDNGTLNFNGNSTVNNFNKVVLNNVLITAGVTLTMNEFFCGSPEVQTNVESTTTSNYTIAFTDNFEKITKFVNLTNCTLSKPQQLLMLTNTKKSSTNVRGIRYGNQSPNGVAKGKPSVTNTLTPGLGSFLVSEPIYN
jgi:hypothetical protein